MILSLRHRFASTAAAVYACAVALLAGGQPAVAAGEADDKAAGVIVIAARATNACFSDRVRVAGFLVPQSEAIATVDSEGYKVTDILVNEGDLVTAGQTLARLSRQAQGGATTTASLRAPAAGMVIRKTTMAGTMASPQGEPMFRIAVDGKIGLDVDVPGLQLPKLKPGATARIAVEGGPEINGSVRAVGSEIDLRTQLGRVRISLDNDPALRIGMFATATIDASRSCGAAIPRAAVIYRSERTSVQVIRNGKVETRAVRVGLLSDTSVEIREGVREGDIVVANAGTSLRDGDAVKTIFAEDAEQARAK